MRTSWTILSVIKKRKLCVLRTKIGFKIFFRDFFCLICNDVTGRDGNWISWFTELCFWVKKVKQNKQNKQSCKYFSLFQRDFRENSLQYLINPLLAFFFNFRTISLSFSALCESLNWANTSNLVKVFHCNAA